MRPVSPPGMPKTNSMPASSSTRTRAWGTSISVGVTLTSFAPRLSAAVGEHLLPEQLDRLHDLVVRRPTRVRVAQPEQEVLRVRGLAPAVELADRDLRIAHDQPIGGEVGERELRLCRDVPELREPVLPVIAVGG